jgi:hypothetical protein
MRSLGEIRREIGSFFRHPILSVRRFWRWYDSHPPYTQLSLFLAVAFLILSFIVTAMYLKIRDDEYEVCVQNNLVRKPIRGNANTLVALIDTLDVPPTAQQVRVFVEFKQYAEEHPYDVTAQFIVKVLRSQYSPNRPLHPVLNQASEKLKQQAKLAQPVNCGRSIR